MAVHFAECIAGWLFVSIPKSYWNYARWVMRTCRCWCCAVGWARWLHQQPYALSYILFLILHSIAKQPHRPGMTPPLTHNNLLFTVSSGLTRFELFHITAESRRPETLLRRRVLIWTKNYHTHFFYYVIQTDGLGGPDTHGTTYKHQLTIHSLIRTPKFCRRYWAIVLADTPPAHQLDIVGLALIANFH
jgi:hypothetical protein